MCVLAVHNFKITDRNQYFGMKLDILVIKNGKWLQKIKSPTT